MDGSRRFAHGNAYFTGWDALSHISFDTLYRKIEHRGTRVGIGQLARSLQASSYPNQVGIECRPDLRRICTTWLACESTMFYHGLGITTPSNGAALLLFLFVVPIFSQFLSPLGAWLM